MRETLFLRPRPGKSLWHRRDPRLKLIDLLVWSLTILNSSFIPLAIFLIVLTLLNWLAGNTFGELKRPLLFFMLMGIAIIVFRAFSNGTTSVTILSFPLLINPQGLILGSLKACRLIALLLTAHLCASTTDPADLSAAVKSLLFFLPQSLRGYIALSLTLVLAFIPQLIDDATTIKEAALSRGIGSNRSILRRLLIFGVPLTEGVYRRSELISDALLSRSVSLYATPPEIKIKGIDMLLSTISIMVLFIALFLS